MSSRGCHQQCLDGWCALWMCCFPKVWSKPAGGQRSIWWQCDPGTSRGMGGDWAELDNVVRWKVSVTLGQVGNDKHLAVPFSSGWTWHSGGHSAHPSFAHGARHSLCSWFVPPGDQHESRRLRPPGNKTSETPGHVGFCPLERTLRCGNKSGTCSWGRRSRGGGRAGVCRVDVVGINGQITEGMLFSEF